MGLVKTYKFEFVRDNKRYVACFKSILGDKNIDKILDLLGNYLKPMNEFSSIIKNYLESQKIDYFDFKDHTEYFCRTEFEDLLAFTTGSNIVNYLDDYIGKCDNYYGIFHDFSFDSHSDDGIFEDNIVIKKVKNAYKIIIHKTHINEDEDIYQGHLYVLETDINSSNVNTIIDELDENFNSERLGHNGNPTRTDILINIDKIVNRFRDLITLENKYNNLLSLIENLKEN